MNETRRKRRTVLYSFLGLVLLATLGVLLFRYLGSVANRAAPPRPRVMIEDTLPDRDALVANQPVVVYGRTEAAEGVQSVELWVNGHKIAEQSDAGQANPGVLLTSQSWVPTAAGRYLAFLRALDKNGAVGQSDPWIFLVEERSTEGAAELRTQVIAAEGDTFESIASDLGVSPDEIRADNPGVDAPSAGGSIDVPFTPGDDSGGSSGPSPSPADDGGAPRVDPAPDIVPTGDATPAVPRELPFPYSVGVPGNFLCLFRPAQCAGGYGGGGFVPFGDFLLPPTNVVAVFSPCTVEVTWTDNSDDEAGFLVYRATLQPYTNLEQIGSVAPSPGTGTRLSFSGGPTPDGEHFYAVVAYNDLGRIWSAPSAPINVECRYSSDPDATIVVEGLDFTLRQGVDPYCYFKLNGMPWERVPSAAGEFLEFEGGTYNIAQHAAGRNARSLVVPEGGSVVLEVQCLAWVDGTVTNLGTYYVFHPSDDWDGQRRVMGSDQDPYTVGYRISRTIVAPDVQYGLSPLLPQIIPDAPPPFNLHQGSAGVQTSADVPGEPDLGIIRFEEVEALLWDYPTGSGFIPVLYNVYRRYGDGDWVGYYLTPDTAPAPAPKNAPLEAPDCSRDVSYRVSAVLGYDDFTAAQLVSPLSETFTIPATCSAVEVRIAGIRNTSSSSPSVYGWIVVNGQTRLWNDHSCADRWPCPHRSTGPATTKLWGGGRVDSGRNGDFLWFRDLPGGWYAQGNNTFRIRLQEGEILSMAFEFFNHRDILDDNLWCGSPGGRGTVLLPASGSERVASLDGFTHRLTKDFSNCSIDFTIRAPQ